MSKKFRIIERGRRWNTNICRIGDILTEKEIRSGWLEVMKYWDGSLTMLNRLLSIKNEKGWYVVFEEDKSMTKSDLKTGMIVENRDGNLAMVLLETPGGSILSGGAWMPLHNFKEDLTLCTSIYRNEDIMKIYQPNSNKSYLFGGLSLDDCELIWEREELSPQQIKIQELEETIKKAQQQIEELKEGLK